MELPIYQKFSSGGGLLVFFDREAVTRMMDRKTRKVFNRFGAATRLTARRSIRKRKKASAPGMPPSSHVGLLKQHIYYALDTAMKSVVVGALRLNSSNVPATLEHGGIAAPSANYDRPRFRPGFGVIRPDTRRGSQGRRGSGRGGRRWMNIVVVPLRTPQQRARSEKLTEEMFGPEKLGRRRIAARPYMTPAFNVTQKRLPQFWTEAQKIK